MTRTHFPLRLAIFQPAGNLLPRPSPISLTADAEVKDLNNQTLAASTTLTVHPSDLYVGFKMGSSWGKVDEPLNFDLVVTDHDGNPVGI